MAAGHPKLEHSAASLLQEALHLELLGAKQVGELRAARLAGAAACSKEAVRRGWLTPYQVEELLQGRGAGLILGQYCLLEPLGGGGMGQVFKAWHRLMRRTVALKVMREDLLAKPEAQQRFRREIELAAQLRHPHIVTAFDAELIGHRHCLVMEYCEGKTLAELVRQTGPLAVGQACACIHQAALGLQHAHERSLIHRDIKPENLLLTQQGVMILDFGLARLRDPLAPESNLTRLGTVMGTPDFMAPEQAQGLHAADARSDLYSLGCTFYFLLAGRVPFLGGAATEKMLRQQAEEPPPLEGIRADVPVQVQAIVKVLMAKDPAKRYQTAAAVATVLEPLAEFATPSTAPSTDGSALAAQATPSEGWSNADVATYRAPASLAKAAPAPGTKTNATPPRQRWPRWWTFAFASLLLVIGVVWFWLRSGNDPVQPTKDERPWRWQLALKQATGLGQVRGLDSGQVCGLALSPDGRWVALAHGNRQYAKVSGGVVLWQRSATALTVAKTWTTKTAAGAVAFSPDSKFLAWGVAEDDAPITIWDLNKKTEAHVEGRSRGIASLAWSPDNLLLAGSYDGLTAKVAIRIWQPFLGKELAPLGPPRGMINGLEFSADGRLLLAAVPNVYTTWLFDFPERKTLRLNKDKLPGSVASAAIAADGKTMAVAFGLGKPAPGKPRSIPGIQLWDVATGEPHASLLYEGDDQAHALAFTPDGQALLAAHDDNVIRVYRLDTYQEETALQGHSGAVHALAVLRDGSVVVSAGADKNVCVWQRTEK